MAMEQTQGNGGTILTVIVAAIVGFGLGWVVGNFNVGPEGESETASAAIDGPEGQGSLTDSDTLPVGDSPILGDPDAPITVVEFTSMQCPFCGRAAGTLNELVENNPGDVRLVFKHFPLGMQQEAKPASIALVAAHRQGEDHFWNMKDALFDRLDDYGSQPMEDLAAGIAENQGMDVDQFREDFNDPEAEAIVDRDQSLGQELGVRGTPHFFINGEVVNGAQPLAEFQSVVDQQMAFLDELREEGVAEADLYREAIERNLGSAQAPEQERAQQEPQEEEVEVEYVPIRDHNFSKGASEEDALVTIFEFSSFQCPFCARGAETIGELVEKYPDEVRVVFKHFPLAMQQQSEPASRAAQAAGNQDRFWDYYDLLYANQDDLGEDLFMQLAEELGLNMDRFQEDYESAETAQFVEQDQSDGQEAGVRGTPGFAINGVRENGAQPLPVFEGHVRDQIEIAREVREETGLSGNELYEAIVNHNKEHLAGSAGQPEPAQPERQADGGGDVDLSVGNSFTKGPEDAAVTIYEFSSFQCPFCARAADTMSEVLEEYPDDVRLVYKNFPLPFQAESEPAARAAVAAGQQGDEHFWSMYEALYDNQSRFGESGLWDELARDIGLDMDQFQSDFESDAVAQQVEAEQSEGQANGVEGTPAFFINGQELSGAQPIDRFRQVIDAQL